GPTAEGTPPGLDGRGTSDVDAGEPGEQRAGRPGAAGDGPAGGGRRSDLRPGGPAGGLPQQHGGGRSGRPLQPSRAGRADHCAGTRAEGGLRYGGPRANRGHGAAAARPARRWHRHLVARDTGAHPAPRGLAAGGSDDRAPGVAHGGQFLSAGANVVPDGDGAAQAQSGRRPGGRPGDGSKKGRIERAYRLAEAAGVQVWCQDEAGPYQAIPQPGAGWRPVGCPARRPHEYLRGGTAKLL
ncbi:MAG: hypothetical protein AVDCRST_MAG88-3077, partial [uncultured Thermomicrobiales bacterium]